MSDQIKTTVGASANDAEHQQAPAQLSNKGKAKATEDMNMDDDSSSEEEEQVCCASIYSVL
jgi:hypothetical protein